MHRVKCQTGFISNNSVQHKLLYICITECEYICVYAVARAYIYTYCNSSNWGQKSKTRVSYWWSCISLFAHVLGVKCVRCPIIHSSTWKLKQNKCTRKCSKRGNTPRKWWFKSNQFKRIHVLTSFCLASDPRQEKRQSRMPVVLKKAEFAPAGVQAGSPTRTLHPEVTGAGGKFQSKNYTGRNANSYINTYVCVSISILTYLHIFPLSIGEKDTGRRKKRWERKSKWLTFGNTNLSTHTHVT